MKKIIAISFLSFAGLTAMAQPPAKNNNIPTDTMTTFRSDTIVTSPAPVDSSQFTSNANGTDTANYKLNDKATKRQYKKTTTVSSTSRSTKKSNASAKKY